MFIITQLILCGNYVLICSAPLKPLLTDTDDGGETLKRNHLYYRKDFLFKMGDIFKSN